MLALEGLAIGVFAATDVFLFYVLFEATLIPIYFLIGGFGDRALVRRGEVPALQPARRPADAGIGRRPVRRSPTTTAGRPTCSPSCRSSMDEGHRRGRWLFLGFFVAFAIKAPMFPVHTWLPDAAEAGDARHVGAAGEHPRQDRHVRHDPLLPRAVPRGRRVGHARRDRAGRRRVALRRALAIGQDDIRRLIAYTSVSHFGFIMLGIFVFNSQGGRADALHVQPRPLHGRAVPRHRHPDRPPRLGADQRLRRRAEGRAGAGRLLPGRGPVTACRCPAWRRSSPSSWCLAGTFSTPW